MSDRDPERLLRRLEPAGPPAALRGRIVGAPAPRGWPWLAAAAALLVLTASLQVRSAALRAQTGAVVLEPDQEAERAAALEVSTGVSPAEARVMAMMDGLEFRLEQARLEQEGRER